MSVEQLVIKDKKQARSLICHFYSEESQKDLEPRCEIHGEAVSVGAASVSDTFELPLTGCCREFISRRVGEIASEQDSKRMKGFPDLTSPVWHTEDATSGNVVEATIDDLEYKKIVAQYAIGTKKAEALLGGPQPLPICPMHGQGIQIEIAADNEAAALKGDAEIKLVGCCKIAIEARLKLVSSTMAWIDYVKFKEEPPASHSVQ